MEGEAERSATKNLYDAALEGDTPSLLNLLREDPFILDRCIIEKPGCFSQSPLHVATSLGHLEFTKEILHQKPELAEEFDFSKRWSPLHIASSKGYQEIAQVFLMVKPNMCFAGDQDGMNPVHIAAINGQVHVLGELLRARMQAGRERANDGETILHLCVKFSQLEALKYLLGIMDAQLVNSKDSDGNTVLHLAVATKQPEMVDCILRNTSIGINALNTNRLTAMDIQTQNMKDSRDEEISRSLKVAKALQAKDTLKLHNKYNRNWLENQRSALLVVASLIGTMAFQVGINPPGGLWQDDTNLHIAGTSVLATKASGRYNVLLISNTIGLVSSLSVIFLLISGLPYRKLFIGILMFTMWIAVSATTFTYLMAILLIFDSDFYKTKRFDVTPGHWKTFYTSLIVWDSLMALLLLGHTIRFIVKQIRQGEQSSIQLYRRWLTRSTNIHLLSNVTKYRELRMFNNNHNFSSTNNHYNISQGGEIVMSFQIA